MAQIIALVLFYMKLLSIYQGGMGEDRERLSKGVRHQRSRRYGVDSIARSIHGCNKDQEFNS